MINRVFKTAVCFMLAAMMVVLSCVAFSAQTVVSPDNATIIYDETITINNHEMYIFTDNIADDYIWSLELLDFDTDKRTYYKVKDYINNP